MNFLAGFLFLASTLALSAAPIDDQIKAFEDAVRTDTDEPKTNLSPASDRMVLDNLFRALETPGNDAAIEAAVEQILATHSSDKVQQLGAKLLRTIQIQRKEKNAVYAAKVDAVLARISEAVKKAKTAAELDSLLQDLRALQPGSSEDYSEDIGSQLLSVKVNGAFNFVTWWQDYLSASAAEKTDEAHEALRRMLEDRRVEAPSFLPRSEILALLDGAPTSPAAAPAPQDSGKAVDTILGKVRKVDDVSDAFNALNKLPDRTFDFSALFNLERARNDLGAGLPATIDLKATTNRTIEGDDISRIVALELLAMLPDYFGTRASNPPKAGETVNGYIDRLAASANSAGNLVLLQRVLSVKAGLGQDTGTPFQSSGTGQFLAGLSQEAGGQYAPAVVSYENALKNPDPFLPVEIVGVRLAAIKSAHPDDFQQGLDHFLTPPTVNPYGQPGFPPNWPPGYMGAMGARPIVVSVLPIPSSISIPAQPPSSSTNAPPVPTGK